MKKSGWWIIPVAVLLVAVILAVMFWDVLQIFLMPKAVLSEALANTAAALQTRVEGSPLLLLGKAFNPEGRYRADMTLETENDLLGDIRYDMTVQANLLPRQLHGVGTVTTGGSALDLSLYMDGDFAAISSDSLLKGSYYGLTYDSFSEDLRSNELLMFALPDETVTQWETAVSGLQEMMGQSFEAPPDISEEDMRLILTGILLLDSKVEPAEQIIDGKPIQCWNISYSATGDEINQAISVLEASGEQENIPAALNLENLESLSVTFCLSEGAVFQVSAAASGSEDMELIITFHEDAAADPISLKLKRQKDGVLENTVVEIDTQYDSQQYRETWDIAKTVNGIQNHTVVSYEWDSGSGDMTMDVSRNSLPSSLQLNLTGTDNGFRLTAEDFGSLLNVLELREKPFAAGGNCTMTVAKGAEISTPGYKNFDEWSLTDLWVLLGSLGGLFGLKIG